MNLEERIEKIEQSQQAILKELNLLEELMKAILVNNALDFAEKIEQTVQNDDFENSSEKYHKSQIGRQVKISNRCNHYFDYGFNCMMLGGSASHRDRIWTIKDYRMGKYKLYWTNGSNTFQLWFDTNDVVF